MLNSESKQAILIITDKLTDHTLSFYHLLKSETTQIADVFLLYHTKNASAPQDVEGVKMETFSNEILNGIGYKAIRQTLVPGSNHFPVLQFSMRHPEYDYCWCIEDDVVFNGKWRDFFTSISPAVDYDFIASHIRIHADMPKWGWWKAFSFPEGEFERKDYYSSFNPVYRISQRAIRFIDERLKNGYNGHHEVLIPTLLKRYNFTMADLSEEDNKITPNLSFCTAQTMRWRPVFLFIGNKKNKLYHPVKQKVSFRQLCIYIKRSLINKKRYRRSLLN